MTTNARVVRQYITVLPILEALKLPTLHPVYRQAFKYADEQHLWERYHITNKLRVAWFLAQVLHESGGLRAIREDMNYRADTIMRIFGVNKHSASVTAHEAKILAGNPRALADRVYGIGNPRKAKELGNTHPGDGFKYRGGGPLQTTGGSAYDRWGKKIGIPLYDNPELIEDPKYTLLPSLMHWEERGCNEFADANNGVKVTKAINGGTNGYSDRITWFNKVWKIIQSGLISAPASSVVQDATPQSGANPGEPASAWEIAKPDEDVRKLQKDLNELGADPKLKEDGLMGPKTELAIRTYQAANNLEVDGIAGDVTLASIKTRLQSLGTTLPTATSERPKGNANEVTGGTLVGTGITIDTAVEKIGPLKELVGDNKYLQIALGVIVLVGLALIVYSQVRKYLWRNQTLIK